MREQEEIISKSWSPVHLLAPPRACAQCPAPSLDHPWEGLPLTPAAEAALLQLGPAVAEEEGRLFWIRRVTQLKGKPLIDLSFSSY